MKVVLRSSSLLFTLLSIVLQVPIRRTKRPVDEAAGPVTEPGRPTDSHSGAVSALESSRQRDLF
jgi:hypothetical protein